MESFLSDNYFDDMDKMISEFMSISRGNKGFMPAVDMYEDNDNVVVETQLAGIDLEKLIFLLRMMFYVLKVKVKKD